MARRRMGFKPTLREQLESANKADRYYAAMAGVEPQNQSVIAPKRERAAPISREGPVVAAISELLAVHPKVAFAVRQNSGMASYEAKSGAYAPVYFYRILTEPKTFTITDFWGFLRDGRMYAFEAKAPGFKAPHGEREFKQAAFLSLVANCGGISGFVTDVSQVAEALK